MRQEPASTGAQNVAAQLLYLFQSGMVDELELMACISENQAGELIKGMGTDWDSLLNEAHFLKGLEGRLAQE